VSQGIFSEESEDYARKGLAAMDERTYTEMRKRQYDRSLASYEKATAAAANPQAAAAPAAAPATRGGPPAQMYRFVTKDGVMQATLAPPPKPAPARAPAPPRPLVKPTMPTDAEIRASLTSLRAPALATLGQILMKRGKADEGEKVLLEAYAAKPPSSTMAAIARVLSESAKKAGNDKSQLEYLSVLMLSGRITADETKDLEAVYKKTHNGSLDGLEAMLDERSIRDHVGFAVTPFARKPGAKPTGRVVLAEVFPGAG
jgi:tetratricopeptide (TPR) repeat protein